MILKKNLLPIVVSFLSGCFLFSLSVKAQDNTSFESQNINQFFTVNKNFLLLIKIIYLPNK